MFVTFLPLAEKFMEVILLCYAYFLVAKNISIRISS